MSESRGAMINEKQAFGMGVLILFDVYVRVDIYLCSVMRHFSLFQVPPLVICVTFPSAGLNTTYRQELKASDVTL